MDWRVHGRAAWTMAGLTLLEAVRNRVAWLVLLIAALSLAAAQFTGALAITETRQVQAALTGTLLRLAAVLVVALFVVTSVVREINDKALEQWLALPIPRAAYYLGRLAGFAAAGVATAALFGAVTSLYAPPVGAAAWTLSLSAELLLVAALSLAAVFTFGQVPQALTFVAGFYLLARGMEAIQLMAQGPLVDATAWTSRATAALVNGVAYLLPDLYRFTSSDWLVYPEAAAGALPVVLTQTLVYLPLLVLAGLFDFYRREV